MIMANRGALVAALLVVSCFTIEALPVSQPPLHLPIPTEAPAHPPSYHHHHHPPAAAPAHPPHHHHHHHHPPPPSSSPVPAHPPPHKPYTPAPPPKPATPPPKPYTPAPKPATPPPKPATPPPKPYTPAPKPATPPPKPATPPPKPYTPAPKPATPPPKPYNPAPKPKPSTPPAKPPVHPPYVLPPRKMVAVQGVVYCKPCKYSGVNTLLNATKVEGASVRLVCKNTKYHLYEDGTTDKNGYFVIKPKFLTTYGVHKCSVALLKSPLPNCYIPSALHGGDKGGILRPEMPKSPVDKLAPLYYSVGPFAFEPKKCY
ncbi:hypothetical protein G4B88_002818 [Cannabis sativa]|uniref:Uncharacterized protein n=1 Tax=Cannabis sativa TaxID=3483 RepID=A0A7J6ECV9_CANSA|nr:hypothetical protein G4B88_002818 [Cannabis sativa]